MYDLQLLCWLPKFIIQGQMYDINELNQGIFKKWLCPPIWTNLEVFSVVKSQTIAQKSFKGLLGNYFDHFQAVDKQKGYPIDD